MGGRLRCRAIRTGEQDAEGPDVSEIVEQIKARLKQIESQFGQRQRLRMSLSAYATSRKISSMRSYPASAATKHTRHADPASDAPHYVEHW